MTESAPVYKTYRTNGTFGDVDLTPPDEAKQLEHAERKLIDALKAIWRIQGKRRKIVRL